MTSNRVPGGLALAPDESTLIEDSFMYSTVAFYLHTELALTNRRFIAARPSTILGLIPVGTSRSSYPIENIAGVNAGTRFDTLGVIFGAVALLVGIAGVSYPGVQVVAVVLILLGAAAIVGAPKQHIEIMNSGGGTITFPVSVFERGRTLEFANHVSEAIARSSPGSSERQRRRPTGGSLDGRDRRAAPARPTSHPRPDHRSRVHRETPRRPEPAVAAMHPTAHSEFVPDGRGGDRSMPWNAKSDAAAISRAAEQVATYEP